MPLPFNKTIASLWAQQQFRYLVIGGVNTLLSYMIGAGLLYVFLDRIHYFFIMVISTVICITVSYLNHKFFVFGTIGNYIQEYLRFYVIYAFPIGFSFVAFPICYEGLGMNPYFAQALIMIVTIVTSYIGHSHFSFRRRKEGMETK